MTGETASLPDLHRQMRLAADEYTSFRNQMLRCRQLTWEQVDGAIKRADKVVALLRIIRGREAMLAAQPAQRRWPPASLSGICASSFIVAISFLPYPLTPR